MLKFRTTNPLDKEQIAKWIEQDPNHAGLSSAGFWSDQIPGVEQIAVEDEFGAIFYVRKESIMRLHIQFAPEKDKRRTAKAIDEFTKRISEVARKNNYRQIIFESVFRPLVRFLRKRGFHLSPNEQVLEL